MALAIGLAFLNHKEKVADGSHDDYIDRLGDFLLSLGNRLCIRIPKIFRFIGMALVTGNFQ